MTAEPIKTGEVTLAAALALPEVDAIVKERDALQAQVDAMTPAPIVSAELVATTEPVQFLLDRNGKAIDMRPNIRAWWVDEMQCDEKALDDGLADGTFIVVEWVPTLTALDLYGRGVLIFDANEQDKYRVQ